MKDPEMAGRRVRTREGRERKRAREQRPKLFLIVGSGVVLITLVALTVWNILSRKAESAARVEKAKMNAEMNAEMNADGQPAFQPDSVPEATLERAVRTVFQDEAAGIGEPADSSAMTTFVKTTVSEKQRSIESARDRYLARSVSGAGDARSATEGQAGDKAAKVEPETIDEADKERVLRKVIPFYRSSKMREAPPVSVEELYLPEPK